MNKNLPPLGVFVRNSFLFSKDHLEFNGVSYGHLISVRSLQNQALQFQVLLETGALYTGLPAHAICFTEDAPQRSILDCQMWDNISNDIDVIQLDTLLYMPCTVKLQDTGNILEGEYLFTIDYVGKYDLSRNASHWKQFHCIRSTEGNFHVYPQYRIQFKDKALCYYSKDDLPKYHYNETIWRLGS